MPGKSKFNMKTLLREYISNLGEYINNHNCDALENVYYFLCSFNWIWK